MTGNLITTILLIIALGAFPGTLWSQTATTTAPTTTIVTPVDSHDTREELHRLLGTLPPEVGKVLKLDPMLWKNEAYVSNYPALAAFAAQHPEVASSPNFYFSNVWIPTDAPPETASSRMWENMLGGIAGLSVFFGVTGILVWIIRTLIEHRQWSRLSKVQAEVHNKLLDRFASNEDLLAYVQTSAGKRFLEAAPIQVDSGTKTLSPPVGRILWSVQVGVVLIAAGEGFIFISGNVEKDVTEPFFALGSLGVAIGAGFVLSAIVSFLLARRLGLWEPAPSQDLPVSRATSAD